MSPKMTLKFTVFALFGQEGLKIRKISLKAKVLDSFHNIFTFLENFDVQIFESFLPDFLGPIFVFWLFGGQKFKNWKILQNMIFLVFNRRNLTFSKFFQFLNFWPPKTQKTKIDSRKSSKIDPRVQNLKFWSKGKILQKLYKTLAFYEIFVIFNPSCPKRAKTVNFGVIFGDF